MTATPRTSDIIGDGKLVVVDANPESLTSTVLTQRVEDENLQ